VTTRATPFQHQVSSDLVGLVPDEVREEPAELTRWIDEALEIGLKGKLQVRTGVDTDLVSRAFDEWRRAIDARIIGPESDFVAFLESWFKDSDSSFRKAFDLDNPNSPMGRLKASIGDDFEEMVKMVAGELAAIKTHIGIEDAVKEESHRGTRHGLLFEDEVAEALDGDFKQSSDRVEGVGKNLIKGTNRKVGDVEVLIDTPVADDLRIILEVKGGSDFTLRGKHTLQDQMAESMKFRGAQGSIAVIDRKHLKKSQSIWTDVDRHRVIVAVDRDEGDFTLLDVAYRVLRYRIIQDASGGAKKVDSLDVTSVNRLLDEIVSDLQGNQKMKANLTQGSAIIEGVRTDLVNQEARIRGKISELQALIGQSLGE